jgi:hypothetical protein
MIAQWEEELAQMRTRIHLLEIAINGRKKDHERFGDETNRLKQRIAVLEFNRQNIKAEEVEAEEKLQKFNADLLRKDEEEKEINALISNLNAERNQTRVIIDEQERYLTDKK